MAPQKGSGYSLNPLKPGVYVLEYGLLLGAFALGKRGEKREFSTGIGTEGIGSLAAGGLCQ